MKELFGVYAADTVALDHTVTPSSALASALSTIWDTGVPSCIGHDLHRVFGWSRSLGIYFEPGITRLYGITYIAENEDESSWIQKNVVISLERRLRDQCIPHLPDLQNKLIPYLNGEEKLHDCNGTALVRENLAVEVFPEIFASADDDGLISLRNLNYLGDGVFRIRDLLLYAHPYFRRSLSRLNNSNDEIIRSLVKALDVVDVKIRLDRDMVGLASTFLSKIEHEYWWGPKFNDDLSSIPVGVTRHVANDRERLFHGINWTDFFWYSRDGQHTFEAEELRDTPSFGRNGGLYGCRYTHSIIDEETGNIIHFDGAVKEYSEEQMIERLDVDLSRSERNALYTKLWRLDGPIPVPLWKEIVTHHFRDNHLVGEYLGGVDNNPLLTRELTNEEVRKGLEDSTFGDPDVPVVPATPTQGLGPRIALSLHSTIESDAPRVIIPLETWNTDSTSIQIVESTTVELVKLLTRNGAEIDYLSDFEYYIVEDMYTNFPLVHHNNPQLMSATILAFQQLIQTWNQRHDDRVINLNFSFSLSRNSVRISILGHVADLPPVLTLLTDLIPRMDEDFAWCDDLANMLKSSYQESHEQPRLQDVFTKSGRLLIKRTFVDREKYSFVPTGTRNGIVYQMAIPDDEEVLYQAITSGSVAVRWAGFYSSTCSKCDGEYRQCSCSKYLDSNTYEKVTSMKPFGFVWTDRPS